MHTTKQCKVHVLDILTAKTPNHALYRVQKQKVEVA